MKIRNLFSLLQRVLRSDVACSAISEAGFQANVCGSSVAPDITEFEWSQWREALADSRLIREPIGRYVARLDDLPRGSWSIPMTDIAALSLEEIRELPGYGARRIGAITATFRTLMLLHSAVAHHRGAVVSWESIEIARADAWLVAAITEPGKATFTGLQNEVLESLACQVRHDLGAGHVDGARNRALSPSRIRQIRQDVVTAIHVRWPRGEQLVNAFLRSVDMDWASKNTEAAVRSLGMFFSRLRPSSRIKSTASQPSHSTPVIHALEEITAFAYESTI